MFALDLVVAVEGTADGGGHAQDGKEFPRDPRRDRVGRFAPLRLEAETGIRHRGQTLKRLLQPAPVAVRLRRGRPFAEGHLMLCVLLDDDPEAIVLVERQRAEHHRVDDRKDGRGRADAQRQHDQGDDAEGGGRPQGPDCIDDILAHGR